MVTSGGSSYPTEHFTQIKGDGSGKGCTLVVSGGAITEFGQNNASNTYVSALVLVIVLQQLIYLLQISLLMQTVHLQSLVQL